MRRDFRDVGGCSRILYWFNDGSEMKFGPNQHNNQLIYYIRDIKVEGPAHPSALYDQISGVDISCFGGGF